MKAISTAALLLFFTQPLLGKVNLLNGQFHHHKIDFKVEAQGSGFELWRAYNSQNTSVGLFGRGWCSNLEYRVVQNSSNGFDLMWCQKIETSFKANKKGRSTFVAPGVRLKRHKRGFYFENDHGENRVFDKQGRLVKVIWDTMSPPLEIFYGSSLELKMERVGGLQLKLNDGMVSDVQLKGRGAKSYKYQKTNLEGVKAGNTWWSQYKYGNNRRLMSLKEKGENLLKLTYGAGNLVSKVSRPNGCSENYSYSLLKGRKAQVVAEKVCSRRVLYRKAYSVSYDRGKKITEIRRGPAGKALVFSPKSGKPLKEISPFEEKAFKYDSRGNIMEFKYQDKSRRYTAQMTYSKKGKVTQVKYSEGYKESIRLTYSKNNALERLRNSKLGVYRLRYKEGRLAMVEKGKRQLRYGFKNNAELDRIQLVEGKKVFAHKLFEPKSSMEDANEIAGFLNEMYMSLGPAYEDGSFLREIF